MDPPAKRGSHLLVLLVVVGFGAQVVKAGDGFEIDDDGWLKECNLWSWQCEKDTFNCSNMGFCLPNCTRSAAPTCLPPEHPQVLWQAAVLFIMAVAFLFFLVRKLKSFEPPAAQAPPPNQPQGSRAGAALGTLLGLVVGCGLGVRLSVERQEKLSAWGAAGAGFGVVVIGLAIGAATGWAWSWIKRCAVPVDRWVRECFLDSPVWIWVAWLTFVHFIKIAVIYASIISATLIVSHQGDPATTVQVLSRVQEVSRVYLPMQILIGGLMSFALSLWVNKAYEGYHQGAREVVGLCDLIREIMTHPEVTKHPATCQHLRGLHTQLRRLLVLIGEAALCPDINAPFEHKHPKPRGGPESKSRANRGFYLLSGIDEDKTPYKVLVEYRLHNMEAELGVCGVGVSEAKELVKGIRTKFRAIVAMNNKFSMNQDGLQDLHDAKVLQLILFGHIYAMPFVYFPYKALGQAVLEWRHDQYRPLVFWQNIFVIGASFMSIWMVVVTFYAFLESAKNLSQVFGDGTPGYKLDIKGYLKQPLYEGEFPKVPVHRTPNGQPGPQAACMHHPASEPVLKVIVVPQVPQ